MADDAWNETVVFVDWAWNESVDSINELERLHLALVCIVLGFVFGFCCHCFVHSCCCAKAHKRERRQVARQRSAPQEASPRRATTVHRPEADRTQARPGADRAQASEPAPEERPSGSAPSSDRQQDVESPQGSRHSSSSSSSPTFSSRLRGEAALPAPKPRDMCDAAVQAAARAVVTAEASAQTTASMDGGVRRDGLIRMGEPVVLHIYDVTMENNLQWVNGILRNVGTGAFHAGVEVFGLEWSYGYNENGATGIHSCVPRSNKLHKYRENVLMGVTPMSEPEVRFMLYMLAKEWRGAEYDFLTRNCCHFSNELCIRLAVGPVPQWVLRLASTGARFRSGVDTAVSHAQAAADAMAARASEIDEQYQISSAVDVMAERVMGDRERPDDEVAPEARAPNFLVAAWRRLAPTGGDAKARSWILPRSEMPRSLTAMSDCTRDPRDVRSRENPGAMPEEPCTPSPRAAVTSSPAQVGIDADEGIEVRIVRCA